jgi:hypothetical protein
MKKIILSIAIACTILTSCEKDKEIEGPEIKGNVEYIIRCNDCVASIDAASGKKVTLNVKGQESVWDTNNLNTLRVITTGQGDSEVNIKVDEKTVYFQLKSMNQTGSAEHVVTVVR